MAIEFGSRKETFENFKVYETMLAGRPFKVEMGKMCGLSNASALIRYGETCVLCNVVMSPKPREGVDFFPLNVEYEEKLYAAGRIPGSFMRREGRPGEKGILTSRVIDRPIRPLFPSDFRNDVSVMCTVMSVDHDCSPEIAALIGTSAALAISDIPWNGPVGALKVGLVNGELVLNPNSEQRKVSDLDVTVVSTGKKVVMIEAGEIVPTSGQIAVNGFSLTNIAERQIPLLRRSVGVIFQDFRLIEKKTVYENLGFAMRAVGSSPREIKKRIPYVLELVGLEGKTDRYPNELSGGEQQRVAIARALINNPSTIIADEPTGNLDPARSLEIMRLLERINQLGTTMVVVTHEKDLVNQFKKRVVTLEQGVITSDGDGVGYNAR